MITNRAIRHYDEALRNPRSVRPLEGSWAGESVHFGSGQASEPEAAESYRNSTHARCSDFAAIIPAATPTASPSVLVVALVVGLRPMFQFADRGPASWTGYEHPIAGELAVFKSGLFECLLHRLQAFGIPAETHESPDYLWYVALLRQA